MQYENNKLTGLLVDSLEQETSFSTRNQDTRSKIHLDVKILPTYPCKPLYMAGYAVIPINDDVVIKRHISGLFFISHRYGLLQKGYQFDDNKFLEHIRSVMYEDIPERAYKISFPIEGTPFWFSKHGKVDIVVNDNGIEQTNEVDNFPVLEARYGDLVYGYAVPPMVLIDAIYRLRNLKPYEENFILDAALTLEYKNKQRKIIT